MIKFLVDDYDNTAKYLVEEIRKQGHFCDFVDYQSILNDPNCTSADVLPHNKGNFNNSDTIMFQGSIGMAQWLLRHRSDWYPLVWLSRENYKCSTYYPKYRDYLINSDYVLAPIEQLLDNQYLWDLKMGHELFIRPDDGLKSFSGRLYDLYVSENIKKDTQGLSGIALISSGKNISEEFRIICAKGEIVTGCKYTSTDIMDFETSCPPDVLEYAQTVLKEINWYPDPMFSMDICRSNGDLYVLELNSFSCAGLYDCDLEKIVKKMVEILNETDLNLD